ncbi:MAG TPA: hypothetical protein VM513_13755 [Kofleriaceae bacterium]|nr:hypothetical protein [Kofleriaceae bacterium]
MLADLIEHGRVALGDVAQLEVVRHPRHEAARIAPRAHPQPLQLGADHREVGHLARVRWQIRRHRVVLEPAIEVDVHPLLDERQLRQADQIQPHREGALQRDFQRAHGLLL